MTIILQARMFNTVPRIASRPRGMPAALALTALLAAAPALRAGNLYVPNGSFESPSTSLAGPAIDSWQKAPQPPTFDPNVFGAWDNLAGVFTNTPGSPVFIDNANANQLAYLFAYPQLALFQDDNSVGSSDTSPTHAFNSTYEPGRAYHLTVGLTSSSYEPLSSGSTLQMSLYYRDASSNLVTVAATNITFDPAIFTNLTHLMDFQVTVPTVNATDAWAGQNIGIQFMSTVSPVLIGGVWDLDNVRLTETIEVPNFSFESPSTSLAGPAIDSWQKAPQPPTFDPNVFGAWDNLAGVFTNTPGSPVFIDNANANQLAYLFAYPQVAIFQDYNSTDWTGSAPTHAFHAKFRPGKAYTLAVGFTSSSYEPLSAGSTLQMSLYYRDASSNRVAVAATTVTYDPTVFTNLDRLLDFQVTIPEVKPTDPWAGQYIGIQFMTTTAPNLIGGVWDLDNVRLTETVATVLNHPGWANGQFSCALQSEPGLAFQMLAATDASQPGTNWTSLATITNVTGSSSFTDTTTTQARRFYRARQSP